MAMMTMTKAQQISSASESLVKGVFQQLSSIKTISVFYRANNTLKKCHHSETKYTHTYTNHEHLPLLQLMHMKKTVPILSWQLKLGWDREHGFIEVPEDSFHCLGIFMIMINVVIQANKLPENNRDPRLLGIIRMILTSQNKKMGIPKIF